MHTRRLRTTAVTAVAGLLILGAVPALAEPTDTPSGTPAPSGAPPAPEEPKEKPKEEQPPVDDPPPAKPDLELTAKVSPKDGGYKEGDSITIGVTIKNLGQGEAKGAKLSYKAVSGAKFDVTTADWKGLDPAGAGKTMAPKEQVDLAFTGRFTEATAASGKIEFTAAVPDDAQPGNDKQELTIPILTRPVGGLVYLDKNNNTNADAGEGAAGVAVNVRGPGEINREVKTGTDGRFAIPDLPAGRYTVIVPGPLADGWVLSESLTTAVVDGVANSADLRIRAERPLADALKVTAKFNEGPYNPGQGATLTITLANGGATDLPDVVAYCNPNKLDITHLEGTNNPLFWDALAADGAGVTIKAGETVTRTVRGTVPVTAIDEGVVHVYCFFSKKDSQAVGGFPTIFTLAKVPGKKGSGNGHFYEDRNDNNKRDPGEGIGKLDVTLTDPFDNKVVATTTTADNGDFKFEDVPAGWYIPSFKGPWKLEFNEFVVISANGRGDNWPIKLVPGPAPAPDPLPVTNLPKNPPANNSGTAGETHALAKTGANVIGLTIGGIAVLLVGVGAVLFTRKRRRS